MAFRHTNTLLLSVKPLSLTDGPEAFMDRYHHPVFIHRFYPLHKMRFL